MRINGAKYRQAVCRSGHLNLRPVGRGTARKLERQAQARQIVHQNGNRGFEPVGVAHAGQTIARTAGFPSGFRLGQLLIGI